MTFFITWGSGIPGQTTAAAKAMAIIPVKRADQNNSNSKQRNSNPLIDAVGTALNLGLYRWTIRSTSSRQLFCRYRHIHSEGCRFGHQLASTSVARTAGSEVGRWAYLRRGESAAIKKLVAMISDKHCREVPYSLAGSIKCDSLFPFYSTVTDSSFTSRDGEPYPAGRK